MWWRLERYRLEPEMFPNAERRARKARDLAIDFPAGYYCIKKLPKTLLALL